MSRFLNVAVEGCCHGELDTIYAAIAENERRTRRKVDLLLVCGDFECVRDIVDLECLAVPQKYRKLNSFHQYVTGEKVAPVTTIFVGGNHEASNVLQSLYYGGWVAPKIYFMGFAGVVNFRGLRIAGLSGIFNQKHYRAGHFETPPYSEDTLRSVYHMRELEVYRMAHMVQSDYPVDVFLSHDWPAGIWDFGNRERLLKVKPYFREDMQSGKLGNPPLMHLLQSVKPSYWFAAHLHVKFAATVVHPPAFGEVPAQTAPPPRPPVPTGSRPPPPSMPPPPRSEDNDVNGADDHSPRSNSSELGKRPATGHDIGNANNNNSDEVPDANTYTPRVTQFLALDKVLPGREFLHFMQIPVQASAGNFNSEELEFDAEWLAVLKQTHSLLQTRRGDVQLPQQVEKMSHQAVSDVRDRLISTFGSLEIPAIGPYIPVVIAGECIPPRHSGARPPQPPLPPGAPAGSGDSGYESGSANSTSGLSDLHFTQESYAAQMALEMQKQELYASMGITDFTSSLSVQQESAQFPPQRDQFGGRGGRGGGRNGGGRGGRGQEQHSYYGPGGAQSNSHQSDQYSRQGNQGRGGHKSSKGHGILFNPTSRVTPLGNAQTDALLKALGLSHIWTRPCEETTSASTVSAGETVPKSGESTLVPPSIPNTTTLSHAGSDSESSDRVSSSSTVHRNIHALSIAPQLVPALPTAQLDDKYGLHAYYGTGAAAYYPSDVSATVSSETAADPLEIDIDDEPVAAPRLDIPAVDPSVTKAADPSELDLNDEYPESSNQVSLHKESDPNAIDLDF